MNDDITLKRKSITFPDGEEGRIYYNPESDEYWPSVTTVTGYRDNPGKDNAIYYWKKKYDGKNGNPYWEHLFDYSGPRGTFIHWYIQTHLVDDDLAGNEEEDALDWVKTYDTAYPYVHSIAKNHRGTFTLPSSRDYHRQLENDSEPNPITLTELLAKDATWALTAFANHCDQLGLADTPFDESDCEELQSYFETEIRKENIIDTEIYVHNPDIGYAGQYDLLYKRPNGDTILADLKTSSQVSYEYKMQLCAYAQSIDVDVDELEVIRLQPDKKDVEISRSYEWTESRTELFDEFCSLCKDVVDIAQSKNINPNEVEDERTL